MLVITTVGTSIFENYRENYNNINDYYEELRDLPSKDWNSKKRYIESVRKIVEKWAKPIGETSAEIKSLLNIQQHLTQRVDVRLLSSDTILSRLAAEIISSIPLGDNIKAHYEPLIDVIEGLQVSNKREFEKKGLVSLVDRMDSLNVNNSHSVCLNITGGYKAVIPYLTIFAQVNNIPMYYVFENTDELIKLPHLPVDINWNMFEKYSDILGELAEGIYENWDTYKLKRGLDEDFQACIWEENGMAELNALGKFFWNKYKNFFLVDVLKGAGYFKQKSGNQREINQVIAELYNRLINYANQNGITDTKQLITSIIDLGDINDLRHGQNPDKDKFIFKSTDNSHVRIVYTPVVTVSGLRIKVFAYERGDFDHPTYIKAFKQKIKTISIEFTTIALRKT